MSGSPSREGPSGAEVYSAAPPTDLEAALAEAEQRFRLAFDNVGTGMAITSLDGRFMRVNRALCEMTGYGEEELLATSFQSLTHPNDVTIDLANRDRLISGDIDHYRREKRYIRKDGSILWLLLNAGLVRDDHGNPLYFVAQVVDMTDRRTIEQALHTRVAELDALHETTLGLLEHRDVQDLLETIVANAMRLAGCENGYLYVVDPDDDCLVVRVGFGVFAGYLGFRLQRGEGIAGLAWERGEPVAVDEYLSLSRARNEFAWLHAAAAVPIRSHGEVCGVIGLAHVDPGARFSGEDLALLRRFGQMASLTLENARLYEAARDELAERRRTELELEERTRALERANAALREADELKTRFVAMASHELRTPLTSILGFSDALLRRWDVVPGDVSREQMEAIHRNAVRLHRLVADLLTMSQIESGALRLDMQECDLGGIAQAVVDEVLGDDALRSDVRVSVPPDAVAYADPHRLEQILVNFLTNAVKYGRPPFDIEVHRENGHVAICVRDHGDGVPQEFAPKMWDAFVQGDQGPKRPMRGVGLGLSIVRSLAEAQGGSVSWEPASPGARFVVRLRASR